MRAAPSCEDDHRCEEPDPYGFDQKDLPVYFNQDPVFNVPPAAASGPFGAGGGGFGRGPDFSQSQNVTPMAVPLHIAPLDASSVAETSEPKGEARPGSEARPSGSNRRTGAADEHVLRPRVLIQFPSKTNEMLLSGTLAGGESIANRALAIDVPLGKGHIILFALRPFWRWQTQGTYFLGFNAILNWNDLDAGKGKPQAESVTPSGELLQ